LCGKYEKEGSKKTVTIIGGGGGAKKTGEGHVRLDEESRRAGGVGEKKANWGEEAVGLKRGRKGKRCRGGTRGGKNGAAASSKRFYEGGTGSQEN